MRIHLKFGPLALPEPSHFQAQSSILLTLRINIRCAKAPHSLRNQVKVCSIKIITYLKTMKIIQIKPSLRSLIARNKCKKKAVKIISTLISTLTKKSYSHHQIVNQATLLS